MLTSQLNPY